MSQHDEEPSAKRVLCMCTDDGSLCGYHHELMRTSVHKAVQRNLLRVLDEILGDLGLERHRAKKARDVPREEFVCRLILDIRQKRNEWE